MKRSAARTVVRLGRGLHEDGRLEDRCSLRRYAIVDEAMLKEAAAKLGAQSEQARRKARKG